MFTKKYVFLLMAYSLSTYSLSTYSLSTYSLSTYSLSTWQPTVVGSNCRIHFPSTNNTNSEVWRNASWMKQHVAQSKVKRKHHICLHIRVDMERTKPVMLPRHLFNVVGVTVTPVHAKLQVTTLMSCAMSFK